MGFGCWWVMSYLSLWGLYFKRNRFWAFEKAGRLQRNALYCIPAFDLCSRQGSGEYFLPPSFACFLTPQLSVSTRTVPQTILPVFIASLPVPSSPRIPRYLKP
jgi:hypothetical protein